MPSPAISLVLKFPNFCQTLANFQIQNENLKAIQMANFSFYSTFHRLQICLCQNHGCNCLLNNAAKILFKRYFFFHRSIVKYKTQKSWWDEPNKWRVGKTFPNAIDYLAEIKILGKEHYVEKAGRHFKFFFLFTSTAWLWKPISTPLVFHVLQTFLRRVKIWIISNSNLVRSPSR